MLNEYHNAIRSHIELMKRRGKTHQLRVKRIQEDEINDPSLVSYRLYGVDKYVDVVQIACEVSYSHELLPMQSFYFPTLQAILQLVKKYEVTY